MRRKRLPLLRVLPFLLLGLLTTVAIAFALSVTVEVQTGAQSQAQIFDGEEDWTVSRWDRGGAVLLRSVRARGASWSPQQAAGAPDTPNAGDHVTAWASQSQDAIPEWLVLEYARPVTPRAVHVHENYCPGALSKVTVFDEQGNEIDAWAGADPTPVGTPSGVSKVPVALNVKTKKIKIYLASDKVPGWNEIDAVGLVSDTGETQWARRVLASSTYASNVGLANTGDPATIVPAWTGLHRRAGDEPGSREDRLIDARGWPLLALKSERDLGTAAVAGVGNQSGVAWTRSGRTLMITGNNNTVTGLGAYGGVVAVNTPIGSFGPTPLPVRPIWHGLIGNVLIWGAAWAAVWFAVAIPRRFVREVGRVRSGQCVECGYDLGYDFLSGCPECGWRRDRGAVATRLEVKPDTAAADAKSAQSAHV